jgi:hypothetical protein
VTEAALSQVKSDQHEVAVTEFEELVVAGESKTPQDVAVTEFQALVAAGESKTTF